MSEEAAKPVEEEKPDNARVKIRDVTDEGASKDKTLRYTKRFIMSYTTEDGELLTGEFVIKRPTLGDQARIGTYAAELREDKPPNSVDRATFALQEWLATVSVVVTQAPPWFDPRNMFDSEPLQRVYEEALAFHASFRIKSLVK